MQESSSEPASPYRVNSPSLSKSCSTLAKLSHKDPMDAPSHLNLEPTLLGAAWRYKWLVLAITVAMGSLAWWYAGSTQAWTATATLAVQDPRTSIVFEVNNQLSPERYVADQIEIAQSRAVARRAAEHLGEGDPPIEIGVEDILSGVDVSAADATDLLAITLSHPDQATAIAGANALADAYQEVSSEGALATFADAINQLDSSIAERLRELDDVRVAISELQEADPERAAVELELQRAIEAALSFDEPPPTAEQDVIDAANAQFDELRTRVELLQIALGAFEDSDQIPALQAEQAEIRDRLSALQVRRDQLAVDAELAGNIVVFSSPAETARASSGTILIVLGVLGGAIVASVIAQSLARRRRNFHSRSEPRDVLHTGLIADVPTFGEERLTTNLPTRDAPQSVSAEAFRFVATGIELRQHTSDGDPFKTVVVASATLAEGKTTVTANTAYAAARAGRRVAVVDADFVNPALTQALLQAEVDGPGLTDLVAGEATLEEAGVSVEGAVGGSITLFRRGSKGTRNPEFFASPEARRVMSEIEENFDLVLIDAPPLLRLAHSGNVVRQGDRVMIVVAHRGDISVAEELQRYLDVVGVPLLGYVYNLAPLRREMLGRESSASSGDETDE